jgi:hypothetical protein
MVNPLVKKGSFECCPFWAGILAKKSIRYKISATNTSTRIVRTRLGISLNLGAVI